MKVYTIKEIAGILKISESTVRRYIRDGRLEVAKFDSAVRKEQLKSFFDRYSKRKLESIDDTKDEKEHEMLKKQE